MAVSVLHAAIAAPARCTGCLGGKKFRPRPVAKVIEEMESIPNNRLFVVDNSPARDREWLVDLFKAVVRRESEDGTDRRNRPAPIRSLSKRRPGPPLDTRVGVMYFPNW